MSSLMNEPLSRRSFLKLAAGTAAGAALFSLPTWTQPSKAAMASDAYKRHIAPIAYADLPADATMAAKSSDLIKHAYQFVLSSVDTIEDTSLRTMVQKLIKDPTPTFMQEYTSSISVRTLYAKLSAQGLLDTSKIDAEHLLPPFQGTSQQPFLTAPGSGYMSHHPYPGGLCTHVASNLHITRYICQTYEEVFGYSVHKDVAIAAQALHDIEKPFVFQWQKDGASLKEYPIAGQGGHHVISLAESIYRHVPADVVVAQACAHGAPSNKKGEEDVVAWLHAAAIIAGVDPAQYGLLRSDGDGLPSPHHQEGYLVHLGDHDFVLTAPAAVKTIAVLKKIGAQDYGMSQSDLNGAKYNAFRNYVGAQYGFMYINYLEAEPNGYELIRDAVHTLILK